MDRATVIREMRSVLGTVLPFLESIPEPHIGWMWESMRDIALAPGQVPARHQQLTMLAVATRARCKYGIDLHTELAGALGASASEITETALLTAHTTALSHYLSGVQYDFERFQREVRAACAALSGAPDPARAQRPSAPSVSPKSRR